MDKRALKILFEAYWSAQGWHRDGPRVSPDDFAYAKAHGVMFDAVAPDHGDTVARLLALIGRLSQRQVADGFLASLSTRRLDWRSALGSYAVFRWLPEHGADPGPGCDVCGCSPRETDFSILNFERHKWGGVRHMNPVYAALDLQLFLDEPPPAPTPVDIGIFRDLVAAIDAVPVGVTSAALHQHFPRSLKANKAERDQVVGILGLCGVLVTRAHPGFAERFVPPCERELPDRHFVDMAYPACWWTGADGVQTARLRELFGHVL